jgi:hypothetical protein
MCYTMAASLRAAAVGFLSSMILIATKNSPDAKIVGWFFLFVTFMQLWDAAFWKWPAPSHINKIATKAAMMFNHLQPLILLLLILHFKNQASPASIKFLWLYIALIIPYSLMMWRRIEFTSPGPHGSLEWKWNKGANAGIVYFVFLATLCLLFVENIKGPVGIFAAVITAISFFWSAWKYGKQNSTGRFWCYFAAFVPLLFLPLV